METIADRFIKMRNMLNINKSQFAQSIQTTPSIVGEIESGKREPSKNILIKLLNTYNVNINWLLSGDGNIFLNDRNTQNIEYINSDSELFIGKNNDNNSDHFNGLYSRYLLEDSNTENKNLQKSIDLINIVNENINVNTAIQIPKELNEYKNKLIGIIEKSDSMEPTIRRASVVLSDTLGFQGDGIYLITINEQYMIKRISIRPDFYVISSDNKSYEKFEISSDSDKLKIVGLVRCVINIF